MTHVGLHLTGAGAERRRRDDTPDQVHPAPGRLRGIDDTTAMDTSSSGRATVPDSTGTAWRPRRHARAAPDGYTTNADDCDDHDAAVHPGVTDICMVSTITA
jgi:hypothetical protein